MRQDRDGLADSTYLSSSQENWRAFWKTGVGTPSADPPRPGIGASSTSSSSAISSNSMTGAGPEAPAYAISRRCRSSEGRTGRAGSDGPRRLLNGRQGKMDRAETQGRRSESPTGNRGSPTEREHVPSSRGGRRPQDRFSPGCGSTCAVPRSVADLRLWAAGRRFHGSHAVGEGAYGPIREELAEEGRRDGSRDARDPPCAK